MKSLSPNPTEFLTLTEAAAEIGLSPSAVSRLIRGGQMPGQKLGTVWRIPVAQWTEFKRGTWKPRTTPVPLQILKRRSA